MFSRSLLTLALGISTVTGIPLEARQIANPPFLAPSTFPLGDSGTNFPNGFPFSSFSSDKTEALSAIQSNDLGGFCSILGQRTESGIQKTGGQISKREEPQSDVAFDIEPGTVAAPSGPCEARPSAAHQETTEEIEPELLYETATLGPDIAGEEAATIDGLSYNEAQHRSGSIGYTHRMDDIPPNPIQPSPIQPDELDKLGAAFVDGAMIEEEDFGIPKYDHNVQELAPPLVNEKQINDINKYKGLDGCVREPIIIGEYKGRDGRVKERIEKKPSEKDFDYNSNENRNSRNGNGKIDSSSTSTSFSQGDSSSNTNSNVNADSDGSKSAGLYRREFNITESNTISFNYTYNSSSTISITGNTTDSNSGGGGIVNGGTGDTSGNYSNVNYFINGVSVPHPLARFQPKIIQQACNEYLTDNENNLTTTTGAYAPQSTGNALPSGMTNASNPAIFTNIFHGYNVSDAEIRSRLTLGLEPELFKSASFPDFRKQCAIIARSANASGFTIDTDFHTEHCNLVSGSIIDTNATSLSGPSNGMYLEIWNRVLS